MPTDLQPPVSSTTAPAAPPSVGRAAGRALPLVVGFALIAAGVVAGLGIWTDALTEVEETQTTHPAVDRLVLDLGEDGTVDVVVADADADEIVVEQHTRTWFRDVDVTQSVEDDVLRISTTRCDRGWIQFGSQCSASFVVTVPASTSVTADVRHGELRLAGVEGQAQLVTAHGEIDVTDVAGRLDLRTGHGNVAVAGAGDDVVVHTDHGEVAVTDVQGGVTATTGHGNVAVADVGEPVEATTDHGVVEAVDTRANTVTLRSGHGDVTFAPATAPSSAVLGTDHGEVSVALPQDAPPYAVSADASGREVAIDVATDPAARDRLDLHTGHGTITVDHAEP